MLSVRNRIKGLQPLEQADAVQDVPIPMCSGLRSIKALLALDALLRFGNIKFRASAADVSVPITFKPDHGSR